MGETPTQVALAALMIPLATGAAAYSYLRLSKQPHKRIYAYIFPPILGLSLVLLAIEKVSGGLLITSIVVSLACGFGAARIYRSSAAYRKERRPNRVGWARVGGERVAGWWDGHRYTARPLDAGGIEPDFAHKISRALATGPYAIQITPELKEKGLLSRMAAKPGYAAEAQDILIADPRGVTLLRASYASCYGRTTIFKIDKDTDASGITIPWSQIEGFKPITSSRGVGSAATPIRSAGIVLDVDSSSFARTGVAETLWRETPGIRNGADTQVAILVGSLPAWSTKAATLCEGLYLLRSYYATTAAAWPDRSSWEIYGLKPGEFPRGALEAIVKRRSNVGRLLHIIFDYIKP